MEGCTCLHVYSHDKLQDHPYPPLRGNCHAHQGSCHAHLEPGEEVEVLADCEPVKEHVVLGADSETAPDLVHVVQNAVAVDDRVASCWRVQTCRGRNEMP